MAARKQVAEGASAAGAKKVSLLIAPPNWNTAVFNIESMNESVLVINRFSAKAQEAIKRLQEEGRTAKQRRRDPKDFQMIYREAFYTARQGWHGINALSFRNAMISACRTANFKMTLGRLTVFVEADGRDKINGMPLVKITHGKPHYSEVPARNANGNFDIRPRPMWDHWRATVRVRYDADVFKLEDIANLLMRAGIGGVGEGRYDSPKSNGLGWGQFKVLGAVGKRGAK